MAEIDSINGIAVASISQVNGIAKSGITNVQGFTFPAGGTPTTYLTKQSSWASGAADGSSGATGYATEVSGQFNKRFLLRTPELDFTNSLANSTLKLEFWFHMYGSNIGNLGVAATDNSTSAANATLGKHFTSDTLGGLTIVYWDDDSDDGSSTASGVRITGQQQSAGHGSTATGAHWRKATCDLNDLAGQSSVYLWFFSKSSSSFRGDVCLDDIIVTGEE